MSHFRELFESTTFSFEFFPPKTEAGAQKLFDHIVKLEKLRPSFVSVTYGAGGSTRQLTRDLVHRVRAETGINTVPHLTCVKHSESDIRGIVEGYAQRGIQSILALRGDPPHNEPHCFGDDRFSNAGELVRFIRKIEDEQRQLNGFKGFGIGVAGFPEGHPSTPNRITEMEYLKAKIDAGADYIITQMFFDNRDLYDFRDRCEMAGIRVPIIAGVMPIQSISGMKRMSELALGMRFPAPLLRMVRRTDGSDEAIRRVGVHWATEQSRDLLDHRVSGIHFYTLNSSGATMEIYKTLGVQDSQQLGSEPTLPF
ncbi:MAG: methylenetetrahydrofolate reductase [NAD(P)H] [Phycisphaerae bacterium]|nr:methylenetetrahydrofolate reductase [NAD(P)H] [Phycisphaerae bacterium]MBM90273.1 methylenetetrahydrofolate reductase [NAD(P)H] [Phycisphaerae bacterium]